MWAGNLGEMAEVDAGVLLTLPDGVRAACAPLFGAYPLSRALDRLIVDSPCEEGVRELADQVIRAPAVAEIPPLVAGIRIYVDDLPAAHAVAQALPDSTGSMWHAILHRREGDFSNSKYWYRNAGRHPVLALLPDFDPEAFVDEVHLHGGVNPRPLLDRQREEWVELFGWCAAFWRA